MPDLAFFKKLKDICMDLQMSPEDLLLIMTMESGISASARNPGSNASGLIQFMPSTLKTMGWTEGHDKFREMDAVNQLDYVKTYIQNLMKANGGPFKSAARAYVAVLYPVGLSLPGVRNEDMNQPILSSDGSVPKYKGISPGSIAKAYDQNKGLDLDKDGIISYGDLNNKMNGLKNNKKYKDAVDSLRAVGGETKPTDPMKKTEKDQILSSDREDMIPENEKTPSGFLKSMFDGLKSMWSVFANDSNFGTYVVKIAGSSQDEVLEFSRIISNSIESQLNCEANIFYDKQKSEIIVNCEYDKNHEIFLNQINCFFQDEWNLKHSSNISYSIAKFASSTLPQVNFYKLENAYLNFRKKDGS